MENKYQIAAKARWADPKYRIKISKAHEHRLPKSWRANIGKGKKGFKPKNFESMQKKGGFQNSDYRGDIHWNWKGGITTKLKLLRNSAKYNIWRNAVFLRDDFTCQECGDRAGNGKAVYLEAHHIKPFSRFPDLRFKISNGITYCKECHVKKDKFRGIKMKDKMSIIEERNKKFYTEKGLVALETRLKSFIQLFNKNKFPVQAKMLGFGNFLILTNSDCLVRIKELAELIGFEFKIEKIITKYGKDEELEAKITYGS